MSFSFWVVLVSFVPEGGASEHTLLINMNNRVAPEPVRIAKNGIAYTKSQFMDYYGSCGRLEWDAARVRGEAEWDAARMHRYTCRTCGHSCVMSAFRHNETEGRCEHCEDEKCRATGVFSIESFGAATTPAATLDPVPEDSICAGPAPASDPLACAWRRHTGGALTQCQASQKLSQRYLPCDHCHDDVLYFSAHLQTCSYCSARVCYGCTPKHPCWTSKIASHPVTELHLG